MQTQWPLVVFTLFVCLSCGLIGTQSILRLRGKGAQIHFQTLVVAAVALVIGGLGSFTHLQHWERIFNGFGHITSGITQELIGCVFMGIVMVVWFVLWYRKKEMGKAVAIVSLIVAAGMVFATAHSYLMPARPAWTMLIVYYMGNACLMGGVGLWAVITAAKKDELAATGVKVAFWGGVIGLATTAVYMVSLAIVGVWDFGYYADPTAMTTAPTHVKSLFLEAVAGSGAVFFWISLVCAVLVIVCAWMAKKDAGKAKVMCIASTACMLAACVCMRVMVYSIGYATYLMF